MSPNVKPKLQALLIADHVYTDDATGKKIVAGVFHQVMFRPQSEVQAELEQTGHVKVPVAGYSSGSPFAFVSITDVRGEQAFALRYVDLSDESVKFHASFKIQCEDPLQVIDLSFPLLKLPADKPGTFALELLWNDEPLGSCRVVVAKQPS